MAKRNAKGSKRKSNKKNKSSSTKKRTKSSGKGFNHDTANRDIRSSAKKLSQNFSNKVKDRKGGQTRKRLKLKLGSQQQLSNSGYGDKHRREVAPVHQEKFNAKHGGNKTFTLTPQLSQSNARKKTTRQGTPLIRRKIIEKIGGHTVHGAPMSKAASGKIGATLKDRQDQHDVKHKIREFLHSHVDPDAKPIKISQLINSKAGKFLGDTKEEKLARVQQIIRQAERAQNHASKNHDGVSSLYASIYTRKDGSKGISYYHK